VLSRAKIDDVVADAQWNELGPQAVLYTASLIYHYYNEVNGMLPCGSTQCFEVTGTVTRASPSVPGLESVQVGDPVVLHLLVDTSSGIEKDNVVNGFGSNGPIQAVVKDFSFSAPPNTAELDIGSLVFVPYEFDPKNQARVIDAQWDDFQPKYGVIADALVPKGTEHDPLQPPPNPLKINISFRAELTTTHDVIETFWTSPFPPNGIFNFVVPSDNPFFTPTNTFTLNSAGSGTVDYLGTCRIPWPSQAARQSQNR
jgi:hypothetical protein